MKSQYLLCPFNRYGVDTPKKGGASVSRHEFVMHRLAFGWSNPTTGRDFGRWPRQPAENVLATRASVPAPRTSADARRPRRCQGPSLVTQDTPIGNLGPFQAGGQAPPIHWVTDSQQGEFNGIPGPQSSGVVVGLLFGYVCFGVHYQWHTAIRLRE